MQGQRNSLSMLSENLSLDHGSMSSDTGINSQMTWNTMQASPPTGLPDFTLSSNEVNFQYPHQVRHDGQNTRWSLGETSSSAAQNQGNQNERKTEHTWSFRPGPALTMEEPHYEFPNILSSDNVEVDYNGNQTTDGSFLVQSSSSVTLPHDLNMTSGCGDHEDDDCQIVERPNVYKSVASSSEQMPSANSLFDSYGAPSGCGEYNLEVVERAGCSLDGRRISCKRKALEVHMGQSSGEGSSNSSQNAERSQWHTGPACQIAASSNSMPTETENDLGFSNGSSQTNPRLRLGGERTSSISPFSLTASGNTGSSRRNLRLRVNGLHQQDIIAPFAAEADVGNGDASSSRQSSRLLPYNQLSDLNPVPAVENASPHAQYVSSVRRNPQTRWSGASTSRTSRSFASAISRAWDSSIYGESSSRNVPRNISEHPMFVPVGEIGSSSQNPGNLNSGGGHNGIVQNVASTFGASGSGVGSSGPTVSHRSCPQYPRRLSEVVRRSLLSLEGTEPGDQSSSHGLRSSSPVVSREIHTPNSRLERDPDGAFGIPHSLRALAAASEGRSNIMSEIRHVLNLMRRGEGLRFEDVMALDHPVFFGMADVHDRHRDMRLDVDNMSYEELLALEERIGNVCTGLNEETIMSRLKQHTYVEAADQAETEPCSICQEEYRNGDNLGTLECGHDFHTGCIKQWLVKKNVCPICKKTGLSK